MWPDLTLDPSFKVKQWFTGFGELSFRWIQICIGSPMRRSSFQYRKDINVQHFSGVYQLLQNTIAKSQPFTSIYGNFSYTHFKNI